MNPVTKLRVKIEDAHKHLAEVNKTLQEIHKLMTDIELKEKYGLD